MQYPIIVCDRENAVTNHISWEILNVDGENAKLGVQTAS